MVDSLSRDSCSSRTDSQRCSQKSHGQCVWQLILGGLDVRRHMYAKPCAKERLILAVAGATTRNGRPDLTFQKELECWILKQNFLIFFF